MRDTTSAPLPAEDLKALRAMAETGDGILVGDFDVSEGTMIRALAGRAVKAVTARRIKVGLELLTKQKACTHPTDSIVPTSGDGWMCADCQAYVAAPPKRYELSGDVECKLCRDSLANGDDELCATCRLAVNS